MEKVTCRPFHLLLQDFFNEHFRFHKEGIELSVQINDFLLLDQIDH